MAGRVYVANISTSTATYCVNNTMIPTPGRAMNPTSYQPYFTLVDRTKYPTPGGTFAGGDNTFWVKFADTLPPQPPVMSGTLTIPKCISLEDDLILHVFRDAVSLMTKRGEVQIGAWSGVLP